MLKIDGTELRNLDFNHISITSINFIKIKVELDF